MKVVINKCYGGFSVSEAVYNELGIPWNKYGHLYSEELGYDEYDYDGVDWEITEYDGYESIREVSRTFG